MEDTNQTHFWLNSIVFVSLNKKGHENHVNTFHLEFIVSKGLTVQLGLKISKEMNLTERLVYKK